MFFVNSTEFISPPKAFPNNINYDTSNNRFRLTFPGQPAAAAGVVEKNIGHKRHYRVNIRKTFRAQETMGRIAITYTGVLLLCIALGGCSNSTEPAKPLQNQVYLPSTLEVSGGQHFAVPISFDNEVALSAISVPLLFPSAVLSVDSISFRDSRVAQFQFKQVLSKPDTIALGIFDDSASVAAGRGLLATLHLWAHGNAPETTFVLSTFDYWRLPLSYFDLNLEPVANPPQFKNCQIHVKTILPPKIAVN
jgi:hypothetical protein